MWDEPSLKVLWLEVISEFKLNFPHYSSMLREQGFKPIVQNNKARYFGQCDLTDKWVSVNLYTHRHSDKLAVVDTMLHEIAHAIDFCLRGRTNHDKTWSKLAKETGCNGNRTSKGAKKMKYNYVICIHTPEMLVMGSGHDRKPNRTPIGKYLSDQYYTKNKEHTIGKLIMYKWENWCRLCDEYGVSYYKEDHIKIEDIGKV